MFSGDVGEEHTHIPARQKKSVGAGLDPLVTVLASFAPPLVGHGGGHRFGHQAHPHFFLARQHPPSQRG